ncbi:hypothetical protein M6D81_01065 [Paenibacillus sp. J5C_2022]|uniref:hypothetical protein n=1 Tax=Paenibacillus sp. J5C2022 TaxID=2977129 RepID=UPI0021D24A50|nr:hypothetical protein [Paenibacillus sp. J5C2022]MCU6707284.1 hypothetical protein [Paenibacillus sp. J5C2022]
MSNYVPLKTHFGSGLAERLAQLITPLYPQFPAESFISSISKQTEALELKARVAMFSRQLRSSLPADYREALAILLQVLPLCAQVRGESCE